MRNFFHCLTFSLSTLICKFDDVFFNIVSPPASLETQRPQSKIIFLLPLRGRQKKDACYLFVCGDYYLNLA
jgi:hypothetical protein